LVSGTVTNFEIPYIPPVPPGPTPIPSVGINPFFIIGIVIGGIVVCLIVTHMVVSNIRKRLLEREEIADEERIAERNKTDLEKALDVAKKETKNDK
jgi:F0F1-type ATP synthase membrane subunit b/b'